MKLSELFNKKYTYSIPYYLKTLWRDPKGFLCGKCHRLNLSWDDCGWWYEFVPKEQAVCNRCFDWANYHGER